MAWHLVKHRSKLTFTPIFTKLGTV